MKVALLCTLAPRPRLLIMDEPFSGMDALVKDELVHGLLEFSSNEGWSVLLCSHDIGEVELLADSVGFLDHGRLIISEPLDLLRDRFRWVEVMMNGGGLELSSPASPRGFASCRCAPPKSRVLPFGSSMNALPRTPAYCVQGPMSTHAMR